MLDKVYWISFVISEVLLVIGYLLETNDDIRLYLTKSKEERGKEEMNNLFKTKEYKILEIMEETTLSVGEEEYSPLGQQEIGLKMCLSRVSINRVFKELREEGYIEMLTRGKWKLTEKAKELLDKTREL